jgi:soluble lytic murein transglycosylase-like protein
LLALPILFAAGPASATGAVDLTTEAREEGQLRVVLRQEAIAYENGEGVEKDPAHAAATYCEAARLGDAESQYNLAWMYANGRGVERSDATAAFFFNAAAEQGLEQARRMLSTVGGPPTYIPDCMREKPLPQVAMPSAPAARMPAPTSASALSAAMLRPTEIRSNAPKYLLDIVTKLAPDYKVQPSLALSIMEAESNFDIVALSPKNAKGLMQLIPETAARFNVRSAYDPEQNIRGGMAYLRWLLSYYEGDITLVAAAYNAGEGAVNRYRGVPPYAETRAYVLRILAGVGAALHPFDPSVTEPSPLVRWVREARRSR